MFEASKATAKPKCILKPQKVCTEFLFGCLLAASLDNRHQSIAANRSIFSPTGPIAAQKEKR